MGPRFSRVTVVAVGTLAASVLVWPPLSVAADPGDVATDYGTDGRAVIEAISSNVGVGSVRSSADGRVVVTFTGDPESGGAALVSSDGLDVVTTDLGGPGTATFGPDGRLYAAFAENEDVVVARFRADGSADTTFGVAGTAVVETGPAIRGDIVVDDDGVVVVGGVFGPEGSAWAARFDLAGQVDRDFGEDGVATLVTTEPGEADLVLATDVHVSGDDHVAVVLTRAPGSDNVTVVAFDSEGDVNESTVLEYPEEIRSVTSELLMDGSVLVAVQTTEGDDDTFHLLVFGSDGTPEMGFVDPELTDDEVGGPIHVTQLRTGPIALAYNISADETFVVRMVGVEGGDLGTMDVGLTETWMYGMTALDIDGGLIFVVDETPVSPVEPDDLGLVKVKGDESGRFIDDDDSVHEGDITLLATTSVTRGCNPPANTRFCPEDEVTRGQMAAFLVRALELGPSGDDDAFTDDDDSEFEDDIDSLAAAGITRGCDPPANTRFCPDDEVTRGQMAAFLVRALNLGPQGDDDSVDDVFTDDDGSVFEDDINRLAAAGITRGCGPPGGTLFCPDDNVTRAQMASFLVRSLQE